MYPPYNFPAMIDDSNTQRHTTEKISTTTPTFGGIVVTRVQEASFSSESRVDEEELDHNITINQFSEVSLGLNASTITSSAAEKSFKREDYIYVSFYFLSFTSGSSK